MAVALQKDPKAQGRTRSTTTFAVFDEEAALPKSILSLGTEMKVLRTSEVSSDTARLLRRGATAHASFDPTEVMLAMLETMMSMLEPGEAPEQWSVVAVEPPRDVQTAELDWTLEEDELKF